MRRGRERERERDRERERGKKGKREREREIERQRETERGRDRTTKVILSPRASGLPVFFSGLSIFGYLHCQNRSLHLHTVVLNFKP